jgi:hypothetical protein
MLKAAGGLDGFRKLTVLDIDYVNEETTKQGKASKTPYSAYVSAVDLQSLRVEMPGDIVIVRNGDSGWATMKGALDTRPQTPVMARSTAHFHLVPLLLPFSLTMDGARLFDVEPDTFEGEPVWRMKLQFGHRFFNNPVMDTEWTLFASRKDGSFVAAEYVPPGEYTNIPTEGMRIRYTKIQTVGGVQLPSQALLEGLDTNGVPNGHVAIFSVKIASAPWDSELFIDPETLESMEEEDLTIPELEE